MRFQLNHYIFRKLYYNFFILSTSKKFSLQLLCLIHFVTLLLQFRFISRWIFTLKFGIIHMIVMKIILKTCGSAWGYIFFGMYHFVLILSGNIIAPAVTAFNKKLHINSECFAYKVFQIVRTGILVVIGEMFFRAERLTTGLSMFGKMVTDFSFSSLNYELMKKLKIDMHDVMIVLIALAFIFVISVLNEKGICVRGAIAKRNVVIRWVAVYALIMFIIIFGAYGKGYVAVDPIYANF